MTGTLTRVILDLLAGWTMFAGPLLALGAVSHRWAILPRIPKGAEGDSEAHARALARAGSFGASLVLAALALSLLRQYLDFRDPLGPAGEEFRLLLTTPWGATWKLAGGAAILAILGFLLAHRRSLTGWLLATVAGCTLAFFPGLTGHAAGAGGSRWMALGADALHVWAAGAWVGGLAVLLFLDSRAGRGSVGGAGTPELKTVVSLFSPIALAGAAVLIVTGFTAAYRELDSLSALWSTGYGRVLSLKLTLVVGVLALGAVNWRRLTPRLGTDSGDRGLRRAAVVELLVANAVMMATAILVRISPGGN